MECEEELQRRQAAKIKEVGCSAMSKNCAYSGCDDSRQGMLRPAAAKRLRSRFTALRASPPDLRALGRQQRLGPHRLHRAQAVPQARARHERESAQAQQVLHDGAAGAQVVGPLVDCNLGARMQGVRERTVNRAADKLGLSVLHTLLWTTAEANAPVECNTPCQCCRAACLCNKEAKNGAARPALPGVGLCRHVQADQHQQLRGAPASVSEHGSEPLSRSGNRRLAAAVHSWVHPIP